MRPPPPGSGVATINNAKGARCPCTDVGEETPRGLSAVGASWRDDDAHAREPDRRARR